MESIASRSPEITRVVQRLDELLGGFKSRTREGKRFTSADVVATRAAIDTVRKNYEESVALAELAESDPDVPPELRAKIYKSLETYVIFVQYLRRDRDSVAQMGFSERIWALILAGPTFINLLRVHAYMKRVLNSTIEAVEMRERRDRERWDRAVKGDPSLAHGAEINASNYDASEFIPADLSKIPPRPQPRLG